ncbi:MAG TPA: GlxA family transcriptional regulator [Solirubrobacterales bacterium]|nr:GlxA family transcriptional regulator [Solirubrobacterales bacterium]
MPAVRRVAFLVYDGIQTLDLTGPWEVLHSAGARGGRPYELTSVAASGARVRTSSGLVIEADAQVGAVEELDTLIVVGGSGTREALGDPGLIAEIRRLAGQARRVASVCSGAFLLGEAGLLDGRTAATHWAYCEQLATRYPRVRVEPDPIYVRDGELITSAGVTAGIDLALALVEEDHGRELALEVARWLVVYARRPGGQSQFSVQLANQIASTPPLQELQGWIGEHLEGDLAVATLAARMHLSERQLTRRFQRELGTSPAEYVEQARLEHARGLLEDSEHGLEQVARSSGFASAEVMRRAFRRRLGASPSEYRDRFRLSPA